MFSEVFQGKTTCVLSFLTLFLALSGAFTVAQGQGMGAMDEEELARQIRSKLNVTTFELQDLEIPGERWGELSVDLNIEGTNRTLLLEPCSVRAWNFKVLVQDETGELREVPAPAPSTYEGTVHGFPESRVVGSILNGRLTALVHLDSLQRFVVQPLSEVRKEAATYRHVVFNTRNEINGKYTCGNTERHRISKQCPCPDHQEAQSSARGTGLHVCEIAFDADYNFYVKNGYSVNNTVNDIESIVNGMRVVYERDVDITYDITTVVVRTSEPDPYTTTVSEALLDEFGDEWNSNMQQIKRDTAHLMTGKNLSGSTIGIAWVGVVCYKQQAYGLSESRYTSNYNQRVALTAHEVGHNWNADHCSGGTCHIMCAYTGGCGGIGAPEFGPVSISSISAFRDDKACLTDEPDPIAPPFFDRFTTWLNPDANNWTHLNDVLNLEASNAPSLPYALQLNANDSGDYSDDEIRSNFILLQGESGFILSYWYQHVGVESGKQLVVEFWNTNDNWQELHRLTSDGNNMDEFTYKSQGLPTTAYHDEFRVRFRPEVDAVNDIWYVDNVYVGSSATRPVITAVSPTAGAEAGGTTLTINGGNFTNNPPMSVRIDGVSCSNVNVLTTTTLTCQSPAGSNGIVGLEVYSDNGGDASYPGFRYFPISSTPYNCLDVPSDDITAPAATSFIVSGVPSAPYIVFFSAGPGPTPTPFGPAGLDSPLLDLFLWYIDPTGYSILPLQFDPGLGPIDFYIHVLSLNGDSDAVWADGDGNAAGTESIHFHINN